MAPRPRDCPCFSGRRYAECCGPLHDRARLAETPEALMRSRFSAFALGLGDYLYDTLSDDHPDRAAAPREAVVRALRQAREGQRFLGLTIVHAAADEVLFVARVFEKGADRSFGELSTFTRDDRGGWRYARGRVAPRDRLPDDLDGLTREGFVAVAGVDD